MIQNIYHKIIYIMYKNMYKICSKSRLNKYSLTNMSAFSIIKEYYRINTISHSEYGWLLIYHAVNSNRIVL